MSFICKKCKYKNNIYMTYCEMCSELPQSFSDRFELSNTIVIGASYTDDDYKYWSDIDPNYIGIGTGNDIFKQYENPFYKNWNDTNFWVNLPIRKKSFNNIYIDRCVWNILSVNNYFTDVINFIINNLTPLGKLFITEKTWTMICTSFIKSHFILNASPEFKRKLDGYIKSDYDSLDIILKKGCFMVLDEKININKNIDFVNNNLIDREQWIVLQKMRK